MLGTLPIVRGGLFITAPGVADPSVMTEEVELDRAGEDGRALTKDAGAGGGEGAANELAEFRWWCWAPFGKGDGGANTEVGVGAGVLWLDGTVVSVVRAGRLWLGTSPVYIWPSSPAVKDSVEQKPSEDEMSRVKPSWALFNNRFSARLACGGLNPATDGEGELLTRLDL